MEVGFTVVVEELKVDGEMMATVMHVKMEAKRMVAVIPDGGGRRR